MDNLQSAVFKTVKEGHLKYLKGYLAGKSATEIKAITSAKIDGTTALITAARQGHLDIVQYLITKCHVDLQQCGSVVFDGETIEDAPPLWCAAAAGHYNIVKCLIDHKAYPNCTTQTNSTPLRAACFDGHVGIVKYLLEHKADIEIANRHEHTCLMIACYKGHAEIVKMLLEAGADVNRCSIKQNTAMHDCAEHGSVAIAKLLLQYNSRSQKDGHGMTPLMTAAVAGHVELTEFFTKLPDCTRVDEIQAYELIGATYLDKKHDLLNTLTFWRKALAMRTIPPVIHYPPQQHISAYGDVSEPNTAEELECVRINPEKCRMIALLIRERILGPAHPDTSYFIRYRGAVYADSGDFEKCVALWMYALDMQRSNLEPLYPMTLSSLLSFAELFSFMQQNRSHMSSTVPKANHKQIMGVLERAVEEIILGYKQISESTTEKEKVCLSKKSARVRTSRVGSEMNSPPHRDTPPPYSRSVSTSNNRSIGNGVSRRSPATSTSCCSLCETSNQRVYRGMVIALHLTALSEIVFKDKTSLTESEIVKIVDERNRLLYKLRFVKDHCKHTLLHLASCARACPLGRYPVTRFPNVDVINVLLKCGFDVNARDCDDKTAAHLAAETAKDFKAASTIDVVNRLLDEGSHIDFVDKYGNTVVDSVGLHLEPKLNRVKHETLQCLAARALLRNGISFAHLLSKDLVEFVESH